MSTTVRHARPSLPQRIASLFRVDTRPQRPGPRLTPVRLPGLDAPLLIEVPDDGPAEFRPDAETDLDAEDATALASLRHRVAEVAPEPVAPVSKRLLREVLRGLRNLDAPAPPVYVPDLDADIRDLHGFRYAIRWYAQRLHAGCECEPEDQDAAAGWLASQYAQLRPAETRGERLARTGIHLTIIEEMAA